MSAAKIQGIYELLLSIEEGKLTVDDGLNEIAWVCIDELGLAENNTADVNHRKQYRYYDYYYYWDDDCVAIYHSDGSPVAQLHPETEHQDVKNYIVGKDVASKVDSDFCFVYHDRDFVSWQGLNRYQDFESDKLFKTDEEARANAIEELSTVHFANV